MRELNVKEIEEVNGGVLAFGAAVGAFAGGASAYAGGVLWSAGFRFSGAAIGVGVGVGSFFGSLHSLSKH